MKTLTFAINNVTEGIILVIIAHIMNAFIPLCLPLNFFTVAVASILKVPGVLMMILLGAFMK